MAMLFAFLGLVTQFSEHYQGDYVYKSAFVRMFYPGESSIPTWFSSMLLLLCSVLLAAIALSKKKSGGRYALHWGVLSVIFLGMSVDEVAQFHESLNRVGSVLDTGGFLYFGWVIPGAAFVIVVALAYLRFLVYLPARTRRLFVLAGVLFVGGALGLEMFGARYAELYGQDSPRFFLPVLVEEFMETMGIIVFCYALLSHVASRSGNINISIHNKNTGSRDVDGLPKARTRT